MYEPAVLQTSQACNALYEPAVLQTSQEREMLVTSEKLNEFQQHT
jgi:hypothetical protein